MNDKEILKAAQPFGLNNTSDAPDIIDFYKVAFNAGVEAAAQTANEASCTNHVLLSIRNLKI